MNLPANRARVSRSLAMPPGSYAFEHHRDALTDADAHRAQRKAALAPMEFVHGSRGKPRTAGAEWVAERDRAAVRIDARLVVGETELPQYRERLSGERLVEFDDVDIVE